MSAVKEQRTTRLRIMKLVVGALVAAWLSFLITEACTMLGCGAAAMPVFLVVAAIMASLIRFLQSAGSRIDAGLVFAFFLFAPFGRALLHPVLSPLFLIATLLFGLSLAYYFR